MSAQETTVPVPLAAPGGLPVPQAPVPLALVKRLCATLTANGVDYCHWKSNEAIDRSASADNDLDLLVEREHVGRFVETVHALGFKQARQRPAKEFPGVLHFIGVDAETGRFVDIHAHYQLVVGDDMTKNHRLPLERAYLSSCRQDTVFRLPAPEFELAALVIRLVLKHATWDAKLTFQGSLAASERREVGWLEARTDWDTVAAVVEEHLPFVDRRLWNRCVAWVLREGPGWDGVGVARDLSHALSAHTRAAWLPDMTLKIYRRGRLFTRRRVLRRPSERNRLEAGGAIIAFDGPDAAARAAAAESTAAWLSTVFRTTTVTFPDPEDAGAVARRRLAGDTGLSQLLREVWASRDRYKGYVRARRASARGELVVCDRFPRRDHGTVTVGTSAQPGALGGIRSRLEAAAERYDRQLLAPDLVIAVPGPGAGSVHAAGTDHPLLDVVPDPVTRGERSAATAETARPTERLFADLRRAVWSRL